VLLRLRRRRRGIVVLPPELRVPAAHGDVVEEDFAAGMSAYVTG
jgi:hypothetical protein